MSEKSVKIVTPEGRAAWCSLYTVRRNNLQPDQEGKYEVTLLIPKTTDITPLKALAKAAMAEKFGADPAKWPKVFRNPIRDGDEKADLDGYKGHWFINLRSAIKPPVFGPDAQPIPDLRKSEVYSGCYGKAYVNAYGYDKAGNKGVSFGLHSFQKTRDGEPFVGAIDGEKVFGKVETGKDDPKNYEAPAGAPNTKSPFD